MNEQQAGKAIQQRYQEAELRRLARVKQASHPPASAIGPELIQFFRQSVQKRQTKLGRIAESWGQLVPEILSRHCALDSFHRGTLVVVVDSASHQYELKQLLLAGLQDQLLLACSAAGLKKITLKRGRWYDGGDSPEAQKLRFS